jgi:threonine aldolase
LTEIIIEYFKVKNVHYPATKLVCLEMTHMKMGGRCVNLEFLKKCRAICDLNGAKMHLDGARFFNACVSMDLEPWEIS